MFILYTIILCDIVIDIPTMDHPVLWYYLYGCILPRTPTTNNCKIIIHYTKKFKLLIS